MDPPSKSTQNYIRLELTDEIKNKTLNKLCICSLSKRAMNISGFWGPYLTHQTILHLLTKLALNWKCGAYFINLYKPVI